MGSRARWGASAFAVCLALLAAASSARADPAATPTRTWGVDGTVNALAVSGTTAFLGGSFINVGPNTGGFGLVDPAGGTLRSASPQVLGTVLAAIADGAGGWYLGGVFTHVGGLPRANLAHVLADGSVDPAWVPSTNGEVNALRRHGDVVYAGGSFSTVNGGTARSKLAAFDATTGQVTPFAPGLTGSTVNDLAIAGTAADPIVIAGGSFGVISPVRANLAAFDETGAVTSFAPNPNGPVAALAVRSTPTTNTVYAAGSFAAAGGQIRSGLASFALGTGAATSWDPAFGSVPESMTLAGSTVYVGGVSELRAFGATGTGAATAFDAKIQGTGLSGVDSIRALTVQDGKVYAVGIFAGAGDPSTFRPGMAAFDATSGALAAWHPSPGNPPDVREVAGDGATIAVGGTFTILNAVRSQNVAAIDLSTGRATSFSPGSAANAPVNALAVAGATLYAAAGTRVVALDAATGATGSFAPVFNARVRALAVEGSTVYAGGDFTTVNASPRRHLALLRDLPETTGVLLGADPDFDGPVEALALSGGTLFAGGAFTHVNGATARNRLAALNATTGAATGFDANVDGPVAALAVAGPTLYAGGEFTHANGPTARNRLAAFDSATGAATAFDPNVDAPVRALTVADSTVFAGGDFTTVGGVPDHFGFAALDPDIGTLRAFDPQPRNRVTALAGSPTAGVLIGGEFTSLKSPPTAASRFAAFALPPVAAPAVAPQGEPAPGAAPPPPGATTPSDLPPRVLALRVTNRRWSVAAGRTARSAAARKGTTFVFTLSEDARTSITIDRALAGRRRGRRCVKATPRRGRRCTRFRRAAILTRARTQQGINRVAFTGRVGRTKLAIGRYRATLVATDASGKRSAPRRVSFTVVPR